MALASAAMGACASAIETVENLTEWLVDPDAIEPGTAMPNVGLSRDEAADIAAYLHTLG